jgi:hypothetical protein
MTKEITTSKGVFIFLEITSDAVEKVYQKEIHFLNISYSIIATTNTITEEQAAQIVGRDEWGFISNYLDVMDCCETYKESLQTLLEANNLPTNKNYIICKKN